MWSKFLPSFVLMAAALAASPSALRAADDLRQPDASATSEMGQPTDLADFGAKPKEVAADSASNARPKTGVPTRAKRKAADKESASARATAVDAASKDDSAAIPEQTASQRKAKSGDDSLQPIPDPMESGPVSIEAASFKGVTPGVSTQKDVVKAWGHPKQIAHQNDRLVELYSVEPFHRIEVNYDRDKVSSIVIRFDRLFPADTVAKQLDLATVRPVLVSNELGEILGLAYPERGVLLAFEAGKEPDKPSMKVAQLVLESITAEPFVLRAETMLDTRCDLSRRDLEQALSLEPDNARAHWLHARVLATMEEHEKAVAEASRAVELDPDDPHYRVTYAQVLAHVGRLPEALAEAQKAAETSQKWPHVKAQALCLVGNLWASGAKPDYKKALSFHTQAIQIADPLTQDSHPAIRLAAKEAMIDAHLGAAHDIAWGDWKEKGKAVTRWLERAQAIADDLTKNEGASQEQAFHVYIRAMAAYVGLRGEVDPQPTAEAAVGLGDQVIASAREPGHKAQLQADLGSALYDAMQICQMRSDNDNALKYGQQAAEYLSKAGETHQSSASDFMLGRLYFRLGAIHVARDHDHRAAAGWFSKAIPLLERSAPDELAAEDLGRYGETFVSMGVSFWEAGQRRKAVALSEKGIKLMEEAARQGTIDRSALGVPYGNLAVMHRKLGETDKADRFEEMASRVKKDTLK